MARRLQRKSQASDVDHVTLKIECICGKHGTCLRLSGELLFAHLEEVRREIANAEPPVTLDLEGISRVDIDGIRLLNAYGAQNIQVMNGALYIREWMRQEAANSKR